jgi:hypothetical protein
LERIQRKTPDIYGISVEERGKALGDWRPHPFTRSVSNRASAAVKWYERVLRGAPVRENPKGLVLDGGPFEFNPPAFIPGLLMRDRDR